MMENGISANITSSAAAADPPSTSTTVQTTGKEAWAPMMWLAHKREDFLTSFILGLVIIGIWAWNRFDKPAFPDEGIGPASLLRPSDLADTRRYIRGFSVFFLLVTLGYVAALIIGPSGLVSLHIAPSEVGTSSFVGPAAFPLFLVLLLTGVFAEIGKIDSAERAIRSMGQAAIGFPRIVQTLTDGLMTAELRKQKIRDYLLKDGRAKWDPDPFGYLRDDDWTSAQSGRIETWLRICSLYAVCYSWFPHLRTSTGSIPRAFRELGAELNNLNDDVTQFRAAHAGDDKALAKSITDRIDEIHRNLSLFFIALVYRQEQDVASVRQRFARVGFNLPNHPEGPDLRNLVIVYLWVILGAGALVAFVWLVGLYLSGLLSYVSQQHSNVPNWAEHTPSMSGFLLNTFAPLFAAALAAILWRASRIAGKRWKGDATDLFLVSIGAMLVGWIALVTIDQVPKAILPALFGDASKSAFDPATLSAYIPWALPCFLVALLLSYTAGRALPAQANARRAQEALLFATVLGACVIGIALFDHWNELDSIVTVKPADKEAALVRAFVGLQVLAAMLGGAVTGAIVPAGIRADLCHPAGSAARAYLALIRSKAEAKLGNGPWVFTRNASLGNIMPAEAMRFHTRLHDIDQALDEDSAQAGGLSAAVHVERRGDESQPQRQHDPEKWAPLFRKDHAA